MECQTDMNYSEAIAFVNEQVEFHERKASEYIRSYPKRSERHAHTAAQFAAISEWLPKAKEAIEFQENYHDAIKSSGALSESMTAVTEPQSKPVQLGLTFEDIDGLPEALLAELGLSDGDKLDFSIARMVEEAGGVLSLDRILIGIFKETGEIHKRDNLNQRIYRMTKRGDLYAVPSKKGVYSNYEISEEQAASLK